MSDTKIALWKNDKREKPTHPILRGGKPQIINGVECWVNAWINAPKDASPEIVKRIEGLVDYLSEQNGKYPIISISLSPVGDPKYNQSGGAADPDDDIPF